MNSIRLKFFTIVIALLSFPMNNISAQNCSGTDVIIDAGSYYFSPSDIQIIEGQTIGWMNYGGNHDVNGIASSISGTNFNNPESFSLNAVMGSTEGVCIGTYTFNVPGVYSYDCSIGNHAAQGMVGSFTVFASIPGCIDTTACNYDAMATVADSSCVYSSPGFDCDGNCVEDADEDGICDSCFELQELIIDCDCNFLDPATFTVSYIDVDEVECTITYACYCQCYNDSDGDGICDENEIAGCIDPLACNYSAFATDSDASCLIIGTSCDDGLEETVNDTVTEYCVCEGVVGIEEAELLNVLIFPNPATSTIQVELGSAEYRSAYLSVFDCYGKKVLSRQLSQQIIDVSALSRGLYTIEIEVGDKLIQRQIILE